MLHIHVCSTSAIIGASPTTMSHVAKNVCVCTWCVRRCPLDCGHPGVPENIPNAHDCLHVKSRKLTLLPQTAMQEASYKKIK